MPNVTKGRVECHIEAARGAKPRAARARIKDALCEVLLTRRMADVTVAEVARAANVSRTTFYAHFDNVGEVYEELVADFQADIQTLPEHLSCVTCRNGEDTVPFCEKVRRAGRFAGVVSDPLFSTVWIDLVASEARKDYLDRLVAAGLSDGQARAIFRFQLNGCLLVSRTSGEHEGDWGEIRRALDDFIAGGLERLGASFAD